MGKATAFWSILKDSFSILRIKNIRIYMFGQSISLIGDWMQTTAQAWLVWELTHRATALGIGAVFYIRALGRILCRCLQSEKNPCDHADPVHAFCLLPGYFNPDERSVNM